MAKWSKEQIIEVLKNLAKQLNKDTLSTQEVARVISTSTINYNFGSLGNALEAAGLKKNEPSQHLNKGNILTDDELFQSLYEVELQIGSEPGYNANSAYGKYSFKPFKKRFGNWDEVLAYYRKWKSENENRLRDHDVKNAEDPIEAPEEMNDSANDNKTPKQASSLPLDTSKRKPSQLYGEPIDFRGLRHAPINEQGVVFLFAMVSRELGFSIEAVQQGFPDCEGKYLYDAKKNLWAKARIEFEYKASSFKEHGHDSNQCDFIVCWTNDWAECPVDIIELKTAILKLPSH